MLIGLFPLVGLSAQNELSMPTDKGNITVLYDGIITNGTFSTLQGRIRNDTPNDITSLVFEVVAYDRIYRPSYALSSVAVNGFFLLPSGLCARASCENRPEKTPSSLDRRRRMFYIQLSCSVLFDRLDFLQYR